MNKRLRTVYPAEFKREAIERAKVGDRSVRSLEMELGLSANLLRQWIQQYERKGAQAFVHKAALQAEGECSVTAEQQLRQLRQRVAQLEEERTILKKALQLLSRDG
jgi:transposase